MLGSGTIDNYCQGPVVEWTDEKLLTATILGQVSPTDSCNRKFDNIPVKSSDRRYGCSPDFIWGRPHLNTILVSASLKDPPGSHLPYYLAPWIVSLQLNSPPHFLKWGFVCPINRTPPVQLKAQGSKLDSGEAGGQKTWNICHSCVIFFVNYSPDLQFINRKKNYCSILSGSSAMA